MDPAVFCRDVDQGPVLRCRGLAGLLPGLQEEAHCFRKIVALQGFLQVVLGVTGNLEAVLLFAVVHDLLPFADISQGAAGCSLDLLVEPGDFLLDHIDRLFSSNDIGFDTADVCFLVSDPHLALDSAQRQQHVADGSLSHNILAAVFVKLLQQFRVLVAFATVWLAQALDQILTALVLLLIFRHAESFGADTKRQG